MLKNDFKLITSFGPYNFGDVRILTEGILHATQLINAK